MTRSHKILGLDSPLQVDSTSSHNLDKAVHVVHGLVKKTVLEILQSSDLSTTTVTKVRIAASKRIHIDLSTSNRKKFVRDVFYTTMFSHTDIFICELSKNQRVTIHEYKGSKKLCIRGFCEDNKGNFLPSKSGINLSFDEWATLSKAVPEINAAVKKVQDENI